MTRKKRRLYLVLLGLICVGAATGLALSAFEDNLVFFYSPTDMQEKGVPADRMVRIGGLVEEGSLTHLADSRVTFAVTDNLNSVPVTYRGILPDLFREGQGVIAEGKLGADGTFEASEVLAKHDENYLPPEVAEALKKSGEWRPESGQPAPTGGAYAQ